MDWALYSVDKWFKSMESHVHLQSEGLSFSKIVPGALVMATGRTSGLQLGVINTAQIGINHGTRGTREWHIIPEPGKDIKDWADGGMGVDGDSGSWIIGQEDDKIYGMVWGRDGSYQEPITLFTPIEDMLADIKETTGAKTVCLPGRVDKPDTVKVKGKRRAKEVILPTVPVTLQVAEAERSAIPGEVGVNQEGRQMGAG
ncbi:hypothetical protein DL98DRAFT_514240 [Cadophora sp. DSE1049]|jgi:hypothetical protein|nr:hypothetical protein DL98DRAFT_514240 [Cadophora sp. DSE1049]